MSTASEPEPSAEEFVSCAVCGRTILRGERLHDYLDPEREAKGVCTLCKPHAEASGWIPAAHAGAVSRDAGPRRTRGLRLRERFARRSGEEPAPSPGPAPGQAVRSGPTPRERGDSAGLEPTRRAPEAPPPPPKPPTPLESFNASERPRTIAGLMRSLGEPRATVRPTSQGELITVAWELSWYQWRVSAGQVSEVAKGGELSELAAEDRQWNATTAPDGQLILG